MYVAYATEVSGELVLSFRANGTVIHALCFLVLPGHPLGINADMSICGGGGPKPLLYAYDEFWNSIEGKRLASGYFHFPVPLPLKPFTQIKKNHKARVKIRRIFRQQVTEDVRNKVQGARAL